MNKIGILFLSKKKKKKGRNKGAWHLAKEKTIWRKNVFGLPGYSSKRSETKKNKANYYRCILLSLRPHSFCFATWEP